MNLEEITSCLVLINLASQIALSKLPFFSLEDNSPRCVESVDVMVNISVGFRSDNNLGRPDR